MNPIKKLASQTAIYGLPSILGRLLNYALVPLHTGVFLPNEYGVVTEMYALVAFLVVVLLYGMETAYFRFVNKPEHEQYVFPTALWSILFTTLIFATVASLNTDSIALNLGYPEHENYVIWMIFALIFDAASAIPLAQLRQKEKAIKFAAINFASIAANIGLNVFFIWFCFKNPTHSWVEPWFDPALGVGYIFLANMLASLIKWILVAPNYLELFKGFEPELWWKMLKYAAPLLIAGFAGIINETLDRVLLKQLLEPILGTQEALYQLGVYGANYKLSIIITLFIQAFRYAAEPYFFSIVKNKNAQQNYAVIMHVFAVVVSVIAFMVFAYLDFFKLFIRSKAYYEGIGVVPILLFANIFLGLYYNLSVWYKTADQTKYGALFSIIGAIVTVVLNVALIPYFTYYGAAWATLASYSIMFFTSYFVGAKKHAIPYNLSKILAFPVLVAISWPLFEFLRESYTASSIMYQIIAFTSLAIITFGGIFFIKNELKQIA